MKHRVSPEVQEDDAVRDELGADGAGGEVEASHGGTPGIKEEPVLDVLVPGNRAPEEHLVVVHAGLLAFPSKDHRLHSHSLDGKVHDDTAFHELGFDSRGWSEGQDLQGVQGIAFVRAGAREAFEVPQVQVGVGCPRASYGAHPILRCEDLPLLDRHGVEMQVGGVEATLVCHEDGVAGAGGGPVPGPDLDHDSREDGVDLGAPGSRQVDAGVEIIASWEGPGPEGGVDGVGVGAFRPRKGPDKGGRWQGIRASIPGVCQVVAAAGCRRQEDDSPTTGCTGQIIARDGILVL